MRTRLVATLAVTGLSATVAACGSSTAPALTNPALLAAHFDSLGSAAHCGFAPADPDVTACTIIASADFGVALGVRPSHIQVVVGGATGSWLGYAYLQQSAGRVAGSTDSVYTVVAYDNDNLGSAVVFGIPVVSDAGGLAKLDSTYWSTQYESLSGNGAASVTSVGGVCAPTDRHGYFQWPIDSQHCQQASIRLSLEVTFHTTAASDSSATISIPSQTINGFVLDTNALQMRSHDARVSGKVR